MFCSITPLPHFSTPALGLVMPNAYSILKLNLILSSFQFTHDLESCTTLNWWTHGHSVVEAILGYGLVFSQCKFHSPHPAM
jgi:hypothetical protein